MKVSLYTIYQGLSLGPLPGPIPGSLVYTYSPTVYQWCYLERLFTRTMTATMKQNLCDCVFGLVTLASGSLLQSPCILGSV